MNKLFKHYDALRVFSFVARYGSFSAAAEPLNLSKGAVSHQIRQLESAVGFAVFNRAARGITLTSKGEALLATCEKSFTDLDDTISRLRNDSTVQLTLGVSTYFASRWLSPRLMNYMQIHPRVRLRLQPMIDLSDLDIHGIDLAVRWGNGNWNNQASQLLFACPAWPSGDKSALELINTFGPAKAFKQLTLLHDRQKSIVWREWFAAAGIDYPNDEANLIIPDPNVRVEGVKDGQGVSINDALVDREVHSGNLFRLSDIELADYGYFLVYADGAQAKPEVAEFAQWMLEAASEYSGFHTH